MQPEKPSRKRYDKIGRLLSEVKILECTGDPTENGFPSLLGCMGIKFDV